MSSCQPNVSRGCHAVLSGVPAAGGSPLRFQMNIDSCVLAPLEGGKPAAHYLLY
jgi:hypothetical protein